MDQAAQMPDLVGATYEFQQMDKTMQRLSLSTADEFKGKDPMSLGLRTLGSGLEELDIRAFIMPDLFPSGDSTIGDS